jgi:hypothetical protein
VTFNYPVTASDDTVTSLHFYMYGNCGWRTISSISLQNQPGFVWVTTVELVVASTANGRVAGTYDISITASSNGDTQNPIVTKVLLVALIISDVGTSTV